MPSGPSAAPADLDSPTYGSSEVSDLEAFLTNTPPPTELPPPSSVLSTELLVLIFQHVAFGDLYGSVQYVDRHWHYVVRYKILGSRVWLSRVTGTDFVNLFRTCEGTLEDPGPPRSRIESWEGVRIGFDALDVRDPDIWLGRRKVLYLYCSSSLMSELTGSPMSLFAQQCALYAPHETGDLYRCSGDE